MGGTGVIDHFLEVFTSYIYSGFGLLQPEVGFNATTTLKRSDFGVKTYLPMIGDDVALRISAPFEKQ